MVTVCHSEREGQIEPSSWHQVKQIPSILRGMRQTMGTRSVTEYSNILHNLWQELDHYQCIEMKTLNETIGIIRGEESRRGVMLETPPVERSAMVVKNAKDSGAAVPPKGYSGGIPAAPKMGSPGLLVCTYRKKPRHIGDHCRKLHGKPSNLQDFQANKNMILVQIS
ncbi:hypothetical protein EZV62_019465 [Acer yangbiense]|uniref:Retrotransposon gag domain-containing protein n=1 Tax=Acer yangbiense TaxID=1000413 RepID=A0A5C7HBI5_9ROSI|nr:hypothetical protein EZV62_019465 [Acer yangbiense]